MQGPRAAENLVLIGTSLFHEMDKKINNNNNEANKLILLLYSHLLCSRKHTLCIPKISHLKLFREKMVVCLENHTKHTVYSVSKIQTVLTWLATI